jgi:putative transposase
LNNGTTLKYNICSTGLSVLKKVEGYEWLKEVNSQTLHASLINLETAYTKFFKKQNKFPKFKKKSNNQSFSVPQHFKIDKQLFIPKMKEGIATIFHRPLEGNAKSLTISKTSSNKYFVSILCEVPKKSKPKTGNKIGIDLGITDFIVLSDGTKIKNPNFNRKSKKKLSKAQQHLSRKTKGSNRYIKQRIKVARINEKITNSRKDFQHKLSTKLINEYDLISLEDLAVKNMIRNHKLAYSIQDSGWSSFVSMLEYKASWYGKEVIKVDRFYPSSKSCSNCDYIIDKLPLNVRSWKCPKCNELHDRDINAAKNILRQGLSNVYSPERCLTDMEGKALGSSNTIETSPCEVSKKIGMRKYILKPLGL